MGDVILKVENLRKVFGDFVANDGISFEVEKGKIYALAGENGAGKSTLMKMLYGIYKIDGGKIFIDGEEIKKYNPTIAREKGFGMVFQDFRLIPAFTALENVFLSTKDAGVYFNKKKLRKKMVGISSKYDLSMNVDEYVWRMDLGQRQHVEIVKVLMDDNCRILIFDEPTSVLAPNEIESFLNLLKTFRDNGFAILLITHKIHEIAEVADVVHILRKGILTHTFYREDGLVEDDIVAEMIGEGDNKETGNDLMKIQGEFTGKTSEEDFDDPIVVGNNLSIKDDYGRMILYNSKTMEEQYQRRVTCGHVTALGAIGISEDTANDTIVRAARAQVYVTTQTSSDLYRMDWKRRGPTRVRDLFDSGVGISIASGSIQNRFHPFGNANLLEEALLTANIHKFATHEELSKIFDMITYQPALNSLIEDYGILPGCKADLVIIDAKDMTDAILSKAQICYVLKNGKVTAANGGICRKEQP